MASKSPSGSPRRDRRNGKKDTKLSFFKLGEIRAATDKDFEYFMQLADTHDGWVKKVERSDLSIWQKECDNSRVKMAKVAGFFKGVKASTAFDVLLDGGFRRCWDDTVIEDKDHCKLDDFNDIGYYSMKWPAPLKNRDFVSQRSWRMYGDDQFVVFNHAISHPDLPHKKNFIRGLSYVTGFVVRSAEGGCKITYVTQSDPRGSIPKWLINFALNKIAPAVFKQMYMAATKYEKWKESHKPDYKPWKKPEQNTLPLADPSLLSQSDASSLEAKNDEDPVEEAPTEECMEELVEHLVESMELKTEELGPVG